MSRRFRSNLGALLLGFVIVLLVCAPVANAQTSNDQQQDRKAATTNAIQDRAVVADQIRQDDADEVRDLQIASSVKTATDAENRVQDAVMNASNVQQRQNTVKLASTAARVEAVEEQSITDRQFMAFLAMAIGGMLFALWLMQRGSAKRLENAAKTLVERTEMLEAHIAETTPAVIAAYKKTRE